MKRGARTPEELETLLEDAFVIRDGEALIELFENGAVLVGDDLHEARGEEEIERFVSSMWDRDHTYVADPRRVSRRATRWSLRTGASTSHAGEATAGGTRSRPVLGSCRQKGGPMKL